MSTDKIFHATVGHNNPASNLATPFQAIGGAVKSAAKAVGKDVVGGVKAVGRSILHNFVDPSINVDKIKDAKMTAMSAKAKSGQFNQ